MKKLELLAPAKNFELGKTAINHGADAVYIAANRFGAREAAGNSLEDIEQLVKYAHKYYAKVFLTLNTILFDDELNTAQKLISDAYNIGCDAAIIQDMALLEMNLPPIPLFASTQTNNQNVEHMKFLQDVGFQRVILARELSLAQIAEIRKHTNVDLESFVHGALCVSYSGQCYLSCALANRSANRGCCAQMCRSAYDLIDKNGKTIAKNKHLLSLRDLNLSAHIEDLIDAGISSFKIEGRLKDESYVKNSVAFYRKKIDDVLSQNTNYTKASSGKTKLMFAPNPDLSFSRGFTNYFIDGRRKKMASINTPKSIGEEIGFVTKISKNSFEIDTNKHLQNGDGICFFDNNQNLQGTKINRAEDKTVFPLSMKNIFVGAKIFRSYNHAFEKAMKQQTAIRNISATINFTNNNKNIILQAADEDANNVTLKVEQCGDIAVNLDLARKNLIDGLSKNSDFFNFSANIICDEIRFYPISTINSWRRTLIEMLLAEREKNYVQNRFSIEKNNIPYPKNQLDYTANVANNLARKFYERHGVSKIDDAFEISKTDENTIMMFNKYCIRHELGLCKKHNADDLFLINNGRKLRLSFDCKKCEMKVCIN